MPDPWFWQKRDGNPWDFEGNPENCWLPDHQFHIDAVVAARDRLVGVSAVLRERYKAPCRQFWEGQNKTASKAWHKAMKESGNDWAYAKEVVSEMMEWLWFQEPGAQSLKGETDPSVVCEAWVEYHSDLLSAGLSEQHSWRYPGPQVAEAIERIAKERIPPAVADEIMLDAYGLSKAATDRAVLSMEPVTWGRWRMRKIDRHGRFELSNIEFYDPGPPPEEMFPRLMSQTAMGRQARKKADAAADAIWLQEIRESIGGLMAQPWTPVGTGRSLGGYGCMPWRDVLRLLLWFRDHGQEPAGSRLGEGWMGFKGSLSELAEAASVSVRSVRRFLVDRTLCVRRGRRGPGVGLKDTLNNGRPVDVHLTDQYDDSDFKESMGAIEVDFILTFHVSRLEEVMDGMWLEGLAGSEGSEGLDSPDAWAAASRNPLPFLEACVPAGREHSPRSGQMVQVVDELLGFVVDASGAVVAGAAAAGAADTPTITGLVVEVGKAMAEAQRLARDPETLGEALTLRDEMEAWLLDELWALGEATPAGAEVPPQHAEVLDMARRYRMRVLRPTATQKEAAPDLTYPFYVEQGLDEWDARAWRELVFVATALGLPNPFEIRLAFGPMPLGWQGPFHERATHKVCFKEEPSGSGSGVWFDSGPASRGASHAAHASRPPLPPLIPVVYYEEPRRGLDGTEPGERVLTCALPAHPAWAEAGVGIEEIERLLNSEAGRAAVGEEGLALGLEGLASGPAPTTLPIRMREHHMQERRGPAASTLSLEALLAAGATPTPTPTYSSTYNPFLLALIGRFVLPSAGGSVLSEAIAIARGPFMRIEYVSEEDQALGTHGPYLGGAQRMSTEYSLSGLISLGADLDAEADAGHDVLDTNNSFNSQSCWHLVLDRDTASWVEIEEPDLAPYGVTRRWVVGVGGDFDTAPESGEGLW